jgi:hypothetical protein
LTPDIIPYAAFSTAINVAFSQHNNHNFKILSPNTGHNFEPKDQRWNKVYILHRSLIDSHAKYLIWLDSDLVILDMGLRFNEVVMNYSWADVIISRDPDPGEIYSIVNTGLIIVKNSAWSKYFLELWWSYADRTAGMDQHVFSELWRSMNSEMSLHIALLEPDALNTKRPATTYHMPYNQVLHMIGSVTQHRKRVFEIGLNELCNHKKTADYLLPPQLGITRDVLKSIESMILSSRSNESNKLLEKLQKKYRNLTGKKYEYRLTNCFVGEEYKTCQKNMTSLFYCIEFSSCFEVEKEGDQLHTALPIKALEEVIYF